MLAPDPGGAEQDAGRDPGVGHVLAVAGWGQDAQPEECGGGLAAEGVAGGCDAGRVHPPGQAGDGGLERREVVEDALGVLDAVAPELSGARVVRGDADAPGVQVGGLDDDEAVGGPVVGQRAVAVQGRTEPVGEEDHRQVAAGDGCGDPHLQVCTATGGGQRDGLHRDDGNAAVEGVAVGAGHDSFLLSRGWGTV